jgi:hypothetical protein
MRSKYVVVAALLLANTAAMAEPSEHAKKPRSHHAAVARPPAQIACTILGCMPIPAECTPVAGKTPSGRPTGYDVILCPPGVWPLK